MIEAKIRLSAKEMELVMNAGWILTKNAIMEKAKWLLEDLQQQMIGHLAAATDPVTAQRMYGTPKISKGENYQGLPYLVLDYPRIFHKENTLAVRTMFWWGNFFSSTLHLGGGPKKLAEKKIITELNRLRTGDFHFCVNDSEWEHHFESSNYVPFTDLADPGFEKTLEEVSFVKIAKKIPLHQWDTAATSLISNFKFLTELLASNFPGDEKAP